MAPVCFLFCVLLLSYCDIGPHAILRADFVEDVMAHASELDEAIIHARDNCFYL